MTLTDSSSNSRRSLSSARSAAAPGGVAAGQLLLETERNQRRAYRIVSDFRPELADEAQPKSTNSAREENILVAAGGICDGSATEAGTSIEAPQLFTRRGVIRQGVALQITVKEQAPRGGHQAAIHRLIEFELPFDLACKRVARIEMAVSLCSGRVLSRRSATVIEAAQGHRFRLHSLYIERVTCLDDVLVQQPRVRTI